MGWLRQYHPGTASLMGVCEPPPIDVTPELDVIRCFACSKAARLKLKDFHNQGEIEDWFKLHVDAPMLQQGCFSYCSECPHLKEGRCYGGCLACHEGIGIEELNLSAPSLEQKMNEALEMGKPDLALSYFKTASYLLKTDLATFAAAIAASRLGEWGRALRYATDANYNAQEFETIRKIGEFIRSIPVSAIKGVDSFEREVPAHFIACPIQQTQDGNSSQPPRATP